MEAKHTAGPWRAIVIDSHISRKHWKVEPEIADIYAPNEVGEANANLTAAAPDGLLLAEAIVENGLVGVLGGDVIFRMAKNLIAKAEGEKKG